MPAPAGNAGKGRRTVNLRGWPGLDGWKAPSSPHGFADRLGERNALVLYAAADRFAPGDSFGLGAALLVAGRYVSRGALLVADDLSERDPLALASVRRWAASNVVCGRPGAPTWEVLTLGAFFDPFARVGCGYLVFTPNAYGGGAFLVGAEIGRFLGLVAEHAAPRRRTRRPAAAGAPDPADGWTVYLPGWGRRRAGGGWYRRSPNRPELKLRKRRVGWQVSWGACGKDADGHRYGKASPGQWVDVVSLAHALDGDRGASFAEHRENIGLAPMTLPLRVSPDAIGAAVVVEAVHALHETALTLDERASEWFTTGRERGEGRGRLSLSRTTSPGAVAAEVLARLRVSAPLARFTLSEPDQQAWAETFHGGRCSFDWRFAGLPFPCAAYDASSAFPLVAHLLDWWGVVTCKALEEEDVTEALRHLCERAVADPALVLDPAVWRRFGFALAEVHPDGERFPVEVEDRRRPDGRMEVTSVFSPRRPMHYAWPDVVAAAALSRRVPRVVRATRLVPLGRQEALRRRLPLLPGLVLDVTQDPVLALVAHRRRLKHAGDLTRAAQLRVVANALAFGNFARFDECRWGSAGRSRVGERPGPWTFLPIASSVSAGSRLLLAVFEAMIAARGGCPVYCDTDCWIVPASPTGGTLDLPDGGRVRLLRWDDLDAITAAFAPLQVFGPDVPVWKCERGARSKPLRSVVFGTKRHVEFTLGPLDNVEVVVTDEESAAEVIDRTDANLGGYYADPPTMSGRADEDDGRRWSLAAAQREVAFALALQRDPASATRDVAPWDEPEECPAPALLRRTVVSPEVLRSLPPELGPRPGSRFVEGVSGSVLGGSGGAPVALDTGDDLAGWRGLRFLDRRSGHPVSVATDWRDLDAARLASLDEKAVEWSAPRPPEPLPTVHVEPWNIRHLGRVSGVIDGEIDGLSNLAARRPRYDEPDGARLRAVQEAARQEGPRAFARRTGLPSSVAARAAAGAAISRASVERALAAPAAGPMRTCECGCGGELRRLNQRWLSNAHRVRTLRKALNETARS